MDFDREVVIQPLFPSVPAPKTDSAAADLIRLCLPAQFAYITIARNAVDTIGEQLKLSEDSRSAVKLAVGEACNNAVQYGSSPENRKILVACRILPGLLEIDVISEDTGFRPQPSNHTMPATEDLAEHGRGLALIDMLMDSVEYLFASGTFLVRLQKSF